MELTTDTPIEIGTHEGWTIFYRPANHDFLAKKGRKERIKDNRQWLLDEVTDENAKEARKKVRAEPCIFTLWRDKEQAEMRVEVTSYSTKGLGVRPLGKDSGGEVFYLDLSGYSYRGDNNSVRVIKDGTDTKRLHVAVEMFRRAKQELIDAKKAIVTDIQVTRVSGSRVAEYHAEEDKIRAAINALNAKS